MLELIFSAPTVCLSLLVFFALAGDEIYFLYHWDGFHSRAVMESEAGGWQHPLLSSQARKKMKRRDGEARQNVVFGTEEMGG